MTALASRKLGRIEDVTWSDPVLTFTIERHGAIVAGSSARAEVQTWEANLASCTAKVTSTTHRQLSPMAARFDAQRAALEIAELVEQGKDDARLEWASDRSSVRVLISTIPELSTGYKETLTGRRRRFSRALEKALSELGWAPARQPYQYRREADAGEC